MRLTATGICLAALLATVSSTSFSTPAPTPINAASRAMQAEAERLVAAGQLEDAIGYFESALAADPRNADAYVGLGGIARTQQLPGKAIAYYREASQLAPDNRAALLGSGEAMLDRGATDRAREQLARLQALCADQPCAEARTLGERLGSEARTALTTRDILPRPVVEQTPPASN